MVLCFCAGGVARWPAHTPAGTAAGSARQDALMLLLCAGSMARTRQQAGKPSAIRLWRAVSWSAPSSSSPMARRLGLRLTPKASHLLSAYGAPCPGLPPPLAHHRRLQRQQRAMPNRSPHVCNPPHPPPPSHG